MQRVSRASVVVDEAEVVHIGAGLVALVGITDDDSVVDAEVIAAKLGGLRIFSDDEGLMNRSVIEVGGEALVVSQFTLYGDVRRGRRPSFTAAASPGVAAPLIDAVCQAMRRMGISVAEGRFGAQMQVELVNDGPVTLVIETRQGKVL